MLHLLSKLVSKLLSLCPVWNIFTSPSITIPLSVCPQTQFTVNTFLSPDWSKMCIVNIVLNFYSHNAPDTVFIITTTSCCGKKSFSRKWSNNETLAPLHFCCYTHEVVKEAWHISIQSIPPYQVEFKSPSYLHNGNWQTNDTKQVLNMSLFLSPFLVDDSKIVGPSMTEEETIQFA